MFLKTLRSLLNFRILQIILLKMFNFSIYKRKVLRIFVRFAMFRQHVKRILCSQLYGMF